MSGTDWDRLTDREKIEQTHRDLIRLFDALNDLQRVQNNQANRLLRNEATLTEVAKAVEKLEKRLDQAQIPPT
jgi:hypothetical protein